MNVFWIIQTKVFVIKPTVIQSSVLHVWAVDRHPEGAAPNVRHNKANYIYRNKIYQLIACDCIL